MAQKREPNKSYDSKETKTSRDLYSTLSKKKYDAAEIKLVKENISAFQEMDSIVLKNYQTTHNYAQETINAYKKFKAALEEKISHLPPSQKMARHALALLAIIIQLQRIDVLDEHYAESPENRLSLTLAPIDDLFINMFQTLRQQHNYLQKLQAEFQKMQKERKPEDLIGYVYNIIHNHQFIACFTGYNVEWLDRLQAMTDDLQKHLSSHDTLKKITHFLHKLVIERANQELFNKLDNITDLMVSKLRHRGTVSKVNIEKPIDAWIAHFRNWFFFNAPEPTNVDVEGLQIVINELTAGISLSNPYRKNLLKLQNYLTQLLDKKNVAVNAKNIEKSLQLYEWLLDTEINTDAANEAVYVFLLHVIDVIPQEIKEGKATVTTQVNLFSLLEFANSHTSIDEFPVDRLNKALININEDRFANLVTILQSIQKIKELSANSEPLPSGQTLLMQRNRLVSNFEELLKRFFAEVHRVFDSDPAYQKCKKEHQTQQDVSRPQTLT